MSFPVSVAAGARQRRATRLSTIPLIAAGLAMRLLSG
jgi:hypothetical protein